MSGGGLTDYNGGSLWYMQDWARILKKENPLLAEMVLDLYDLLTTYDYYLAGDYGSDRTQKDWNKFREKWFNVDDEKVAVILREECERIIQSAIKGYF